MGLKDKLPEWLGGRARGQPAPVLILGLERSGKSSLLAALRERDNCDALAWHEAGGTPHARALWERQCGQARAVLWVLDASDALRLAVARDELQLLLTHPAVRARRLPLLVLAHKSDLPTALPPARVAAALGLERASQPWHVCASSAHSGAGLSEGVAWLAAQLRERRE